MDINLIVAISDNNVIGLNNSLPWNLPEDLEYVKKITSGNTIIMGRKSFESIGKPLPNRKNIIITREINAIGLHGVFVSDSMNKALSICEPYETIFIFGGAEIYTIALKMNIVNRLYITRVHITCKGDTFFPPFDYSKWRCVSTVFSKKTIPHTFEIYDKVNFS